MRIQRRRREASGAKGEPPGGVASGALAAEEAAERYLSKMPAGNQTRDAVRHSEVMLDRISLAVKFRLCGKCAKAKGNCVYR